MRYTKVVLTALVVTVILPIAGRAENPNVILASDKEIVLELFDDDLDRDSSFCNETDEKDLPKKPCDSLYSVTYTGTAEIPPSVPEVKKAFVDEVDEQTLHLILSEPISLKRTCTPAEEAKLKEEKTEEKKKCIHALGDFKLVLRRLLLGSKKEPSGFNIPIAPTVAFDFGTRQSILYRGIRRTPKEPPLAPITVNVFDADAEVSIPTRVLKVGSVSADIPSDGQSNWRLIIDPPLKRESTLSVTVSGIDQYDGEKVSAKSTLKVEAFPKGRDDAILYIRGEKVYDQLGDDQGSVDFKLEQKFAEVFDAREWWYLLSATVGSASLGLSQTGTASLGHRWWLGVDQDLSTHPAWSFSVAPTFRTDRDFKNRDLGLDLILEGQPGRWYNTLEARRQREEKSVDFGWWLKPRFAIEGGGHLASSSEQVEDDTFARGVAGFNLLLETDELFTSFDTLSLTVDVASRYLANDELTIDEDQVLEIEDGYKPYLRAELAYGFGPVALSVVHENGKLPPAFKTARATTVGLTFKF